MAGDYTRLMISDTTKTLLFIAWSIVIVLTACSKMVQTAFYINALLRILGRGTMSPTPIRIQSGCPELLRTSK